MSAVDVWHNPSRHRLLEQAKYPRRPCASNECDTNLVDTAQPESRGTPSAVRLPPRRRPSKWTFMPDKLLRHVLSDMQFACIFLSPPTETLPSRHSFRDILLPLSISTAFGHQHPSPLSSSCPLLIVLARLYAIGSLLLFSRSMIKELAACVTIGPRISQSSRADFCWSIATSLLSK